MLLLGIVFYIINIILHERTGVDLLDDYLVRMQGMLSKSDAVRPTLDKFVWVRGFRV